MAGDREYSTAGKTQKLPLLLWLEVAYHLCHWELCLHLKNSSYVISSPLWWWCGINSAFTMCQSLYEALVYGFLKIVVRARTTLLSPAFLLSPIFVWCHTCDVWNWQRSCLQRKSSPSSSSEKAILSQGSRVRLRDQELPESTNQTCLCGHSCWGCGLLAALCFGADLKAYFYTHIF